MAHKTVQITVDQDILERMDEERRRLDTPRSVVISRLLHAWIIAGAPAVPRVCEAGKHDMVLEPVR